ncbi:hypothetical protein HDK90DRAFT_101783 [Phyllosticta capitalensis]|uniref:Uncharacterized protein n=1 Tax=Phyllosticta capitalensis TaxID=121624 RepID=A0ABR1YB19_9PEZI
MHSRDLRMVTPISLRLSLVVCLFKPISFSSLEVLSTVLFKVSLPIHFLSLFKTHVSSTPTLPDDNVTFARGFHAAGARSHRHDAHPSAAYIRDPSKAKQSTAYHAVHYSSASSTQERKSKQTWARQRDAWFAVTGSSALRRLAWRARGAVVGAALSVLLVVVMVCSPARRLSGCRHVCCGAGGVWCGVVATAAGGRIP